MDLTIEYLVIIEKRTSEALFRLCDSLEAFDKFLQTEPSIKIANSKIQHDRGFAFGYEVKTGEVKGKEQRFFHLKLSSPKNDEETIEQLVKLSRTIKKLIHDAEGQPETLWNDVSLFYSERAYVLVHRIENLMRKLIAYFMLTTVGKEWAVETFPSAVKEAVDKSKRKQYLDVLYQVDFIHLGDFLFREYASRSIDELYDKLDTAQSLDEFTLHDLRSFRAQSNWDRYFSTIVKCEAAYLDTRWKQLYDLRCMVAHNALIGKDEYERIVRLADEVATPLQEALNNLDQVYIPEEDKEQVAENVVSNISAYYGEFILLWKSFESQLLGIAESIGLSEEPQRMSPIRILDALYDNEFINEELLQDGKALIQFRNVIVHDTSIQISEEGITDQTRHLRQLIDSLKTLLKPVSFNDECVRRVEKHLQQSFVKHTKTTYLSEDGTTALTCVVSKAHKRGNQTYYWFGFHKYHRRFLETRSQAYAAFGCGTEDTLILIPFAVLVQNLDFMSITDNGRKYYWHVHILHAGDKLLLQLSGADPVDLSNFLLPIVKSDHFQKNLSQSALHDSQRIPSKV